MLIGVVSMLGSAEAHAAGSTATRYACGERQKLLVQRDERVARVIFLDRTYDLRRRQSGIGEKYLSRNAALIIDGPSAVFIAGDRLQLGTCLEIAPIPPA